MRRNISRVKVLSELYQYDLLNQQVNVDSFDELLKEVDEADIDKMVQEAITENEMLYTKTPHNIVINEIVNLSKEYSQTDDHKTSKFNNAVLDNISKTIKAKENK